MACKSPMVLQRGTGEVLLPRFQRTHVGSSESIKGFCGLPIGSTGTISVWKPMEVIQMKVVAAGECRRLNDSIQAVQSG